MPLKIAMIGAGSVGFTRCLMGDVLAVPELQDTQFAFTDISEKNLNMVTALCRRDVESAKLPAKILSTMDRRKAIADADYIICMIRQGGLEAFKTDIDIPLKYGVDQCVGDTLCAGGIMYAQRTIPALLDFCNDIRQVAKPDALFLNYSNPMAMNTWACNQYGNVKMLGLCHGVQGGHWQITHAIELWAKRLGILPKDYLSPGNTPATREYDGEKFTFGLHRREVDIVCAGINHQTWYIRIKVRGRDIIPLLPEILPLHPEYCHTEKVRIDVLKRFGFYSTESNGHLSEYVPWYRKRTQDIPNWIDMREWIHGETGGYLRVCKQQHNWDLNFPKLMKADPMKIGQQHRSEEHGSYIIEALETGRTYRGHFNIVNRGHITNLPDGCIVEIPGYVDKNGISMPVVGALPIAGAATCAASVRVQEMGMQAAVAGDVNLLKLAMLHDPLVGAVCTPEEVWQMTDEMLVTQRRWLPNYSPPKLNAAAARLKQHQKKHTRVKLLKTRGAARLRT